MERLAREQSTKCKDIADKQTGQTERRLEEMKVSEQKKDGKKTRKSRQLQHAPGWRRLAQKSHSYPIVKNERPWKQIAGPLGLIAFFLVVGVARCRQPLPPVAQQTSSNSLPFLPVSTYCELQRSRLMWNDAKEKNSY